MFDDIRPYNDSEIQEAMGRIVSNENFIPVAKYIFPDRDPLEISDIILSINTISDFQNRIMYWVNRRIIDDSIDIFSYNGIENIDKTKQYLFVSNHRDIMLDASLLQNIFKDNDIETSEITFGANLMQGEFVIDIGKSNKMFKVDRPGGNARDFYNSSLYLSQYIRYTILNKKQSVWIAQRNGRTKDGIDRTDKGIIKMFGMSRRDDKVKSILELNITPVAVSYEWESCDILKTLEIFAKTKGPYIKKQGEDLNSIINGVKQYKGRVHYEICKPISEEDVYPYLSLPLGDFNRHIAEIIDKRICSSYKLWPNNYIAHDLLHNASTFSKKYSEEERMRFVKYMEKLENYADDNNIDILKNIFLGIYANPVDSFLYFS